MYYDGGCCCVVQEEDNFRITSDQWTSFLEFCKSVDATTLEGYDAENGACMSRHLSRISHITRRAFQVYPGTPFTFPVPPMRVGPILLDEYAEWAQKSK